MRRHDDRIVVRTGANTPLWFRKSNGGYVGDFFITQTLLHDEDDQVFRLYDLDGTYLEFSDSTGLFRLMADPAGNKVEVKALLGYVITQVERSFTSAGSTTTEQYFYEYDATSGDNLLTRVTLRRKVDAGAWTDVSRANYSYYGNEVPHGELGDLKTVTTEIKNSGQWQETGTTLYRYYKEFPTSGSSSSSSSSSSGTAGYLEARLLKYVVNPASYQRLADDPEVSDPLTASDFQVSLYADFYFEYDDDRRVTKEIIQGGSRTFTFSYSESGNADGYNSWKTKTVETLPGGTQNIVYANYAGQTMLHVFKDGDDQWLEFWKYNDDARAILHANPSAIIGYDEQYADLLHEVDGNYEYLRDEEGLIELFDYDAASGYLTAERIKEGEDGDEIKLREYEYTSCVVPGVGESTSTSSSSSSSSSSGLPPQAFLTSKETVYPDAADQDKKLITTYSYTFHTGTCQVKQKTTTLPSVSSGQNGSGIAAVRKEYFDVYGNLEWAMDERGFITRMKYDIVTGAIIQLIQDVDTSQQSGVPSGWETPTGGGQNLVTDFEHDPLGRMTQSLGPAHAVDLDGTATSVRRASWTVYQDEDHELWTAQGYATGEEWDEFTLVNPVSITKYDENGLVQEEIAAVRASTSGKLSASDTFAQSSYVRWTTHQYTDCCFLASTRTYHAIPTSGAGEEGTNYDQVNFGYDSSKRRNRQVTGGGTITRTVFDSRSKPASIYVGTNDTGATADDPTGGGAEGNNMVIVTEYEYDDGADGGDGLLTKDTQYVD